MRADLPPALLRRIPRHLPADEHAAWLAACRLALAERDAVRALLAVIDRQASAERVSRLEVAADHRRRRVVDAVALECELTSDDEELATAAALNRARLHAARLALELLDGDGDRDIASSPSRFFRSPTGSS